MLTVTELARKCNLSRATILYYERQGLLIPAHRSDNGYRWYGEQEIQRLESIAAYRSYGLPIKSIKKLLGKRRDSSSIELLKEHFYQLEQEINRLKEQQQALVALLQEPDLLKNRTVTKERWVAIMQAAGFDHDLMSAWHRKFEELEPDGHQEFLESLGIGGKEIQRIRNS